jgi:hypothetical protein
MGKNNINLLKGERRNTKKGIAQHADCEIYNKKCFRRDRPGKYLKSQASK